MDPGSVGKAAVGVGRRLSKVRYMCNEAINQYHGIIYSCRNVGKERE